MHTSLCPPALSPIAGPHFIRRVSRRIAGVLCLAASLALTVDGAVAQSTLEFRKLQSEVGQMQDQLDGLLKKTADLEPARAAEIQLKIADMQEQIRKLTGRVEELDHKVQQTNDRLDRFQRDVEFRFQDLGVDPLASASGDGAATTASTSEAQLAPIGGAPSGSSTGSGVLGTLPADASGTPLGTPDGAVSDQSGTPDIVPVALPAGSSRDQYDFAFGLLKRGEYPQARSAFTQFIEAHPQDQLAGNAQYWLGETYYAVGDYREAADAFLAGYTTYGESPKAPDSLLKLGITLSALGQTDAACATFSELGTRFPQATQSVVQRARAEQQKAGCS